MTIRLCWVFYSSVSCPIPPGTIRIDRISTLSYPRSCQLWRAFPLLPLLILHTFLQHLHRHHHHHFCVYVCLCDASEGIQIDPHTRTLSECYTSALLSDDIPTPKSRLASSSKAFCLSFPHMGITGTCYFIFSFLFLGGAFRGCKRSATE